jgi:hypothetical protein
MTQAHKKQILDNAMSARAAEFEDLMEVIKSSFYDMPAPESETLNWGHVGNASHINDQLRNIANFLGN